MWENAGKMWTRITPNTDFFYTVTQKRWPVTLLKKRLQHMCFPVKFGKLSRTPVLKNIYEQLLLHTDNTHIMLL